MLLLQAAGASHKPIGNWRLICRPQPLISACLKVIPLLFQVRAKRLFLAGRTKEAQALKADNCGSAASCREATFR